MQVQITYTRSNPTIFDYRKDLASVAMYLYSQVKVAPNLNFQLPDKPHMYYYHLEAALVEGFASVVQIETPLSKNITLHKLGAKEQLSLDTSIYEGWMEWVVPKQTQSIAGIMPSIGRSLLAAQVMSSTTGFLLVDWPGKGEARAAGGWSVPKEDKRRVYKSSADDLAKRQEFDVFANRDEAWVRNPPKILRDFMVSRYPQLDGEPRKAFVEEQLARREEKLRTCQDIFNLD